MPCWYMMFMPCVWNVCCVPGCWVDPGGQSFSLGSSTWAAEILRSPPSVAVSHRPGSAVAALRPGPCGFSRLAHLHRKEGFCCHLPVIFLSSSCHLPVMFKLFVPNSAKVDHSARMIQIYWSIIEMHARYGDMPSQSVDISLRGAHAHWIAQYVVER